MSTFYISCHPYGKSLLVRGIENGRRFQRKVRYQPRLFLPTENADGEWRTLDGTPLEVMDFDNMKDARDFIKNYEDVENFHVYGNTRFQYVWIYETYPDEIDYDSSLIRIANIDIEVESDDGFPDPKTAEKRMLSITVKYDGIFYAFGLGEYKEHRNDVKYIKCRDEIQLLHKFLTFWEKIDVDIVTGWNCVPVDSYVFGKDYIDTIDNIHSDLMDSKIKTRSPISKKDEYKVSLSNGRSVYSSLDHIYPVLEYPKGHYTKLKENKKNSNILKKYDKPLSQLDLDNYSYYLEYPLHNNCNEGIGIPNNISYIMGLIFTDGSLKDKNNIRNGFTVYQSDLDLLKSLDDTLTTSISGNSKKGYSRYVKYSILSDYIHMIYDNNQKNLNVKEISKMSNKEFMYFLSGMLDGDGYHNSGNICLCNFDNFINDISILCQWNGIFSYESKNRIIFPELSLNSLYIRKYKRWSSFEYINPLNRNSSQKSEQIRYKRIGDKYYIRIIDVEKTRDDVNMMDIETDTHYFISNGIRVHNCQFFDIPYLVNRITNVLGESEAKRLSPWKLFSERTTTIMGKTQQAFDLTGIAILDYLEMFKKYEKQQESYRLDHIGNVVLGEKKIDYSEYANLTELYRNNHQKFLEYNIFDVELVDRISEEKQLIEQVLAIAYDAHVNYNDVFTQVRMWDVIIHNYLADHKIAIPQPTQSDKEAAYAGAYVKEPIPGMYEWVVSYDLASMYPHLIMQYNLGPETLIEGQKADIGVEDVLKQDKAIMNAHKQAKSLNASLAANGFFFDNSRVSFLNALMDKMYKDRKIYKNKMLEKSNELEEIKDEMYNRGIDPEKV